jgi:hypothetical protein
MQTDGGQTDENEREGDNNPTNLNNRIKRIYKGKQRWHRFIPWMNTAFFLGVAILVFSLADFSSLAMGVRNITQALAVEPGSSQPGPTEMQTMESAAEAEEASLHQTSQPQEIMVPSESELPVVIATSETNNAEPQTVIATDMPPVRESNYGYMTWDQIDADSRKILRNIYTQEELDLLFAPRKWVTMPDVIGLSRSEAVNRLHALGLVPRVIY